MRKLISAAIVVGSIFAGGAAIAAQLPSAEAARPTAAESADVAVLGVDFEVELGDTKSLSKFKATQLFTKDSPSWSLGSWDTIATGGGETLRDGFGLKVTRSPDFNGQPVLLVHYESARQQRAREDLPAIAPSSVTLEFYMPIGDIGKPTTLVAPEGALNDVGDRVPLRIRATRFEVSTE